MAISEPSRSDFEEDAMQCIICGRNPLDCYCEEKANEYDVGLN